MNIFESIIKKEQEKQKKEWEKLSQYKPDKQVKANKTNLNKIIKWGSSRFNEYKKSDVVKSILTAVEKGEDTIKYFHCGTYSSRDGRRTGDYKLVIRDGIAKLIVDYGKEMVVYELVK